MLNYKKIAFVLAVMIISVAVGYLAFAWTDAPSGTPPTCPSGYAGCDRPINVSSTAQTKAGALTITADFTANRLLDSANVSYYIDPANSGVSGLFAGQIGIGTTNPGTARLKIQGGVLDMSSQRAVNLASPSDSSDAATKGYVDAQASGGSNWFTQGGWSLLGNLSWTGPPPGCKPLNGYVYNSGLVLPRNATEFVVCWSGNRNDPRCGIAATMNAPFDSGKPISWSPGSAGGYWSRLISVISNNADFIVDSYTRSCGGVECWWDENCSDPERSSIVTVCIMGRLWSAKGFDVIEQPMGTSCTHWRYTSEGGGGQVYYR